MGPRGLLHPLPLPSRRGGVIGVDWLLGLPMTAAGFDHVQVHVDHLFDKVHPVPTRATDMAADASRIVLEMALRVGCGPQPQVHERPVQEFMRRIGSSLPQKHQRQGRAGQWRAGPAGRLGREAAIRRLRH